MLQKSIVDFHPIIRFEQPGQRRQCYMLCKGCSGALGVKFLLVLVLERHNRINE